MPRLEDAQKLGQSRPEDLKANAEDCLILMTCAFERNLLAQIAHMGHISLELAIKAAYARRNEGRHPWGHDLGEITLFDLDAPGVTLFDILEGSPVADAFFDVKSAWSMQDRYLKRAVSQSLASTQRNAYEEVIRWTLDNYA